jgi:hypothetical protein
VAVEAFEASVLAVEDSEMDIVAATVVVEDCIVVNTGADVDIEASIVAFEVLMWPLILT